MVKGKLIRYTCLFAVATVISFNGYALNSILKNSYVDCPAYTAGIWEVKGDHGARFTVRLGSNPDRITIKTLETKDMKFPDNIGWAACQKINLDDKNDITSHIIHNDVDLTFHLNSNGIVVDGTTPNGEAGGKDTYHNATMHKIG